MAVTAFDDTIMAYLETNPVAVVVPRCDAAQSVPVAVLQRNAVAVVTVEVLVAKLVLVLNLSSLPHFVEFFADVRV